jgi:hypothetical protein
MRAAEQFVDQSLPPAAGIVLAQRADQHHQRPSVGHGFDHRHGASSLAMLRV